MHIIWKFVFCISMVCTQRAAGGSRCLAAERASQPVCEEVLHASISHCGDAVQSGSSPFVEAIKSWLWPCSILSKHDMDPLTMHPVQTQLYTWSFLPHPQLIPLGVCWVQKKKEKKKELKKKTQKKSFFIFHLVRCIVAIWIKKKVHLVCWIMCKLVITQSEYLYNCLYFFIMILERNVFIFLTSVPDVSSVGLTLWLVWWDSYLCIEPLLWWILCMQCLGNTVGNMGRSWY